MLTAWIDPLFNRKSQITNHKWNDPRLRAGLTAFSQHPERSEGVLPRRLTFTPAGFNLLRTPMRIGDWLELSTLQLLSKHLTSIVAAGFSFYITTSALRRFVGPGTVNTMLESFDEIILVVLFLWFTYQMLLLLWKARIRWPNGNDLLNLVA